MLLENFFNLALNRVKHGILTSVTWFGTTVQVTSRHKFTSVTTCRSFYNEMA